jgi:hypothetical protein
MFADQQLLEFTYGLLVILAVFVAFGVARRVLRSLIPASEDGIARALSSSNLVRILCLLALAGVLVLPLLDALSVVRSVAEIASPGNWRMPGQVQGMWGTTTLAVYDILATALVVATYAVTFVAAQRGGFVQKIASLFPLANHRSLPLLATLAIASLAASTVKTIVLQVVWLQVPLPGSPSERGAVGFVGAWILGLMALSLLLIWAGPSEPGETDDDSFAV